MCLNRGPKRHRVAVTHSQESICCEFTQYIYQGICREKGSCLLRICACHSLVSPGLMKGSRTCAPSGSARRAHCRGGRRRHPANRGRWNPACGVLSMSRPPPLLASRSDRDVPFGGTKYDMVHQQSTVGGVTGQSVHTLGWP